MAGLEQLRTDNVNELYSNLGRYRAAQRRVIAGRCAVCGAEFAGTVLRQYCSRKCLVRAHRRRKAASGQPEED